VSAAFLLALFVVVVIRLGRNAVTIILVDATYAREELLTSAAQWAGGDPPISSEHRFRRW